MGWCLFFWYFCFLVAFQRLLGSSFVFTGMSTATHTLQRWPSRQPVAFLILAAIVWLALYQALNPAAEALVAALPVDRASHLGGALQFFFYDTPKVLMLLTGVVFVMGMVNSYFTPERTRALLAGRSEGMANVMAATLGIVTPFCSCSAVPLFIGFVQAGVPLGVTFSFLISAPMINEVALTLLFSLFGWKIAALYLGLGLSVAIVSGWIIGRLKMEAHLEGVDIEIAFNSRYISDVIRNVDEECCTLSMNTPVSPCVISPMDGDGYLYLVLPVRVYN